MPKLWLANQDQIDEVELIAEILTGGTGLGFLGAYAQRSWKMDSFGISLVVGLLLGTLSVWLVNFINGRYSRKEKKLSLLLLKRARWD